MLSVSKHHQVLLIVRDPEEIYQKESMKIEAVS